MLSGMVDHPAFKTRIGQIFPLDQIRAAMKAETEAKKHPCALAPGRGERGLGLLPNMGAECRVAPARKLCN